MSIRDFHREAGIPYRTLQQYLADERQPKAAQVAKLTDMGIDREWLFTGEYKPSLTIHFPGEELEASLFAASSDISLFAYVGCLAAINDCYKDHLERGEPYIEIFSLIHSVWDLYKLTGQLIESEADKFLSELHGSADTHAVFSQYISEALIQRAREVANKSQHNNLNKSRSDIEAETTDQWIKLLAEKHKMNKNALASAIASAIRPPHH